MAAIDELLCYYVTSDIFEVALLIGACFLVNYVTADAKTNWAEGMVLVAFYVMIVSFSQQVYPCMVLTSLYRRYVHGSTLANLSSSLCLHAVRVWLKRWLAAAGEKNKITTDMWIHFTYTSFNLGLNTHVSNPALP